DPKYPEDRIKFTIEDSGAEILLTHSWLSEKIEFEGAKINLDNAQFYDDETDDLEIVNSSNDLAYVIYTSGSTGVPKGVMVKHRSIINTLLWRKGYYGFNDKDVTLQIPSYTFDSSVADIFTSLISGSSLILIDQDKRLEISYLKNTIIKNEVTNFLITPSSYNSLLDSGLGDIETLRVITVAGESLRESVLRKHFEIFKDVRIINEYGPTENSVCTTVHEIEDKESEVLIGKPISNISVYILDKHGSLSPIGVPGELCVGGAGLAHGYLNRTELTAEKFVPNPFIPGERMYRTGDLVRWLPDGNIEFMDRIDHQVKIRGFRIELGEIESRILELEAIKEAVVTAREDESGDKYLCAYIVSEKEIPTSRLRNLLSENLPDYMIPTYLVRLERLPLTPNGKVDRKALPEPEDGTSTEYVAPRNATEEVLTRIWNEVLGREKVGIYDNFFDLGGHSLKATILMSKIFKEFSKDIPLKVLFKSPTIKELSEYIGNIEDQLYLKIGKVEEKESYEVSSAQKRMYILQQFDKDSIAYNSTAIFELEGNIDKAKMEETFKKLTERHDALRTYFEEVDDKIVQKLEKNHKFDLVYRNDNRNIEDIIESFVRPFDLGKAPLFRVELVETKGSIYLLIDIHHSISDGVSTSILVHEFAELYNGKTLKPLKLQYKDFVGWQSNFINSKEIMKQEKYWTDIFSDEIPVLNIPIDYERPAMKSFEGESVEFEVDEKTTVALKKLARKTGTTMHMVLLSAFNILLSKYSGQEDIIVGTPIAGRLHADLQNIMGMFVNTLALRNKPEGNKNYIDFLKEVKENSLKAYENQSYQFDLLVEKLDVKRVSGRNPLFDVMFNMIDTVKNSDIQLDGLLLKLYNNNIKISQFDLTLNALEYDNVLRFSIEYCIELFYLETINIMAEEYINILEIISNNSNILISDIIYKELERTNTIDLSVVEQSEDFAF
ncbi:MAG: amino acid adenylation domain-containing protein, partial [Bacillota bacterium]